jgi:dihydrofolate reductase
MIGPHPIEGFAIVSADGMIADANGAMPDCMRNDADQHFLQAAMDRAAAIVHGRRSHEGGPRAAKRKRVVVTRQVPAIAADPSQPNALLWNPAGASLEQAVDALGVGTGSIAVIGGTDVFSLFLPLYDVFHLSRATRAKIPGGQPLFSAMSPTATVEDVLMRDGLLPSLPSDIDAAAGITLTNFQRIKQ